MSNEPVLIIENLGKHFGDVVVLRDVNAALLPGTVTAFIGPNGAGKTTLFHAITGDIVPDGGAVLLNGQSITGMAPWKVARKGLGKMFQDVRVFENLTIIENVLLALHDHPGQTVWASLFQQHAEKKLEEEAVMWLTKAGVEAPFDRLASALSFGNKKILALARLMAGKFEVLLLDEPTSGMSPVMISRIAKLIKQLSDQGTTIALVEHNCAFVAEVAERSYLLQEGAILDGGPTMEVLDREENREILIGL